MPTPMPAPMPGVRRALIALSILCWTLAPRLAAACPACTGQNDKITNTLKVVGCMMLVPFLVAGAVIRVIRRVAADDATADLQTGTHLHVAPHPRGPGPRR